MSDPIRSELERIKGNKELLTAEDVVEWAQAHPDSALYASLEWDDAAAGKQYRLWQARRLIALHIVSEPGVRKFVSLTVDRSKPGGGYRDVEQVAQRADLRGIMVRDALEEFRRVRSKYQSLKEFAAVYAELDKVAAKVEPPADSAA